MKKLNVTQMENLQGGLLADYKSCEAKIAQGAAMGFAAGLVGAAFTGPAAGLTFATAYFGGMAGGLMSCLWN